MNTDMCVLVVVYFIQSVVKQITIVFWIILFVLLNIIQTRLLLHTYDTKYDNSIVDYK